MWTVLLAFSLSLALHSSSTAVYQESEETRSAKYDDWLLEDSGQFKIKMRYIVTLPNGQPARDFNAHFQSPFSDASTTSYSIDGNCLTATLLVNAQCQMPWVTISTNDGLFSKVVIIPANQIRRNALEGIKVDLTPARTISIRVSDPDGTPIENATVLGLPELTDSNGVADMIVSNSRYKSRRIDVVAPNGWVGTLHTSTLSPDQLKNKTLDIITTRGVKQTIKAIDPQGNPVPNVMVIPQLAAPAVNMIYDNGPSPRTNASGETKVTWIPQSPGSSGAIRIFDHNWSMIDHDRQEDVWTIRVKKIPRKRVTGIIHVPNGEAGGILVRLTSYDHPSPRTVDQLYVLTNSKGEFSFDAVPGATYSAFVEDSHFVSDFWDGVVVSKNMDTVTPPQLNVTHGVPVRIVCTQGPDNLPMVNQAIAISWRHNFLSTNQRRGSSGPRLHITTDKNGLAIVNLWEGRVEASINSGIYRDKQELVVGKKPKQEIRFHRGETTAHPVSGQLKIDGAKDISLTNAEISIFASDGKISFSTKTRTDKEGRFEATCMGARFIIFAITADKRASGFLVCSQEESKSIALNLVPTSVFKGQLLDENDNPITQQTVTAEAMIADPQSANLGFFSKQKVVTKLETKSDERGRFQFDHVPTETPTHFAVTFSQTNRRRSLGRRYLRESDVRETEIIRVNSEVPGTVVRRKTTRMSFEQKLSALQEDSRINSARTLVLLLGNSKKNEKFAQEHLLDYDQNMDVMSYFPLMVPSNKMTQNDIKQVIVKRNWLEPNPNQIVAVAIDGTGNEVGQISLDTSSTDAPQQAVDFLAIHKTASGDVERILPQALKRASESGRKVWVITGHNRCGPCILLGRWIDKNRSVLEKDFLFLKIDMARDLNAREFSNRITNNQKGVGVPFHAILNDDGSTRMTSVGPLGNIGFPSGHEGRFHIRKMINGSRNTLSDDQVNSIVESLRL